MGFKTEISKMHYEKDSGGALFGVLKFCSAFYGIASGIKNRLYDAKFLKPKRVDAYVISVGNFTTGGVGKTPVVSEIANYLTEKGEKVAIVSRGYGSKLSSKKENKVNLISDGEKIYYGADEAGDEPVWLAMNTKAVVITAPNRYEGAKFAVDKFGVDKIILDDGFQHRKLHRDLDIVLIDSEKGFGNENLLPAGPLREGVEAFSRVDRLVVVSKNVDHSKAEKYARIMGKKLKKQTSVCYIEPDYVYDIFNPEERLNKGEKVLAFSAIGQPEQFYKFLSDYEVVKTIDFDDHHGYCFGDVDKLCSEGISKMVTTEKDASKLMRFDFDGSKIFALKLKTGLDVENLLK